MEKKVITFFLFFVLCAEVWALRVRPFSLPWMNGEGAPTYNSSQYPSGIFVVEAYFIKNAPRVNKLASDYKNEARVQVLDVGIDTSDLDYSMWIDQTEPNHPVLKDANRVLISQLGTRAYPSTYVLDCKGNVIANTVGAWNMAMATTIRQAVDKLLSEDCVADNSDLEALFE